MLKKHCLTLLALLFISGIADASVTLSGTRVVYDAGKKESNINVNNSTDKPFLVQSWVENNGSRDTKAPFIVTPPLFRLDGGKSNALRIIYNGTPLPQDRESLFWLNVKSIPSSAKEDTNKLQIAVNTRIKLFYRPVNLSDDVRDIAQHVDWTVSGNVLTVRNNSSYYISVSEAKINGQSIDEINMLSPKNSAVFPLKSPPAKNAKIHWKYINDYGGNSQAITQIIK